MQLDHITIRTCNLLTVRDFFLKIFDLEELERPRAIARIPGHWLYSKGKPIIHLIGSYGTSMDQAGEAFDHVGFRLEGYKEFRAKLEQLDIRYSLMDIPELFERRIFFNTPGGLLLEAVFTEPMVVKQGEPHELVRKRD